MNDVGIIFYAAMVLFCSITGAVQQDHLMLCAAALFAIAGEIAAK